MHHHHLHVDWESNVLSPDIGRAQGAAPDAYALLQGFVLPRSFSGRSMTSVLAPWITTAQPKSRYGARAPMLRLGRAMQALDHCSLNGCKLVTHAASNRELKLRSGRLFRGHSTQWPSCALWLPRSIVHMQTFDSESNCASQLIIRAHVVLVMPACLSGRRSRMKRGTGGASKGICSPIWRECGMI